MPDVWKEAVIDLKFENMHLDTYGGGERSEHKYRLVATNKQNETVGYIDYTMVGHDESVVYIDWIIVDKDERRRGIGTQLYLRLADLYPQAKINWGYTSPEGEELRKSIVNATKSRRNPIACSTFFLADDDLETRWDNGLVIADGIEILEIDEEDINQQLAAIYELTYKYDQVDLHEWSGTGEKSQVLAICEAGIRDVAGRLAEMLDEVFAHWLELHAITNPRAWGRARVGMTDEYVDEELALAGAINEYTGLMMKQQGRSWSLDAGKYYQNMFLRELSAKISELPSLKRALRSTIDEYYQMDLDEWKSGNLDTKPGKMDFADFIEIHDVEELIDGLNGTVLRDVLSEIYAVIVFPIWYGQWSAKGIDATRRRVEKSYEQIEKIRKHPKSFEVRALASEINKIIQTAHQTGSMTDYVSQRWNLEEGLLDYLSDGLDTVSFDRTLTAMGVDLDREDRSAIARRRQRDDAAKIVRAAWEDLAEEQSGRRNPRMSLQEAVIRRL